MPNKKFDNIEENVPKRKRTKNAEPADRSQEGEVFEVSMKSIIKHIKYLVAMVKDTYKPKTELKDISGKLILQLEKLQKGDMAEWLERSVYKDHETES